MQAAIDDAVERKEKKLAAVNKKLDAVNKKLDAVSKKLDTVMAIVKSKKGRVGGEEQAFFLSETYFVPRMQDVHGGTEEDRRGGPPHAAALQDPVPTRPVSSVREEEEEEGSIRRRRRRFRSVRQGVHHQDKEEEMTVRIICSRPFSDCRNSLRII